MCRKCFLAPLRSSEFVGNCFRGWILPVSLQSLKKVICYQVFFFFSVFNFQITCSLQRLGLHSLQFCGGKTLQCFQFCVFNHLALSYFFASGIGTSQQHYCPNRLTAIVPAASKNLKYCKDKLEKNQLLKQSVSVNLVLNSYRKIPPYYTNA